MESDEKRSHENWGGNIALYIIGDAVLPDVVDESSPMEVLNGIMSAIGGAASPESKSVK